jgi:hypothetical protein
MGGITQRTKDHALEGGSHLMHERDRERRLADAPQAQHAHHLAALLDHPLLQLQALGLSPVKLVHIEGIPPIQARRGGCRLLVGQRLCGLGYLPFEHHESRRSRGSCQLRPHPEGLEVGRLSGCQP